LAYTGKKAFEQVCFVYNCSLFLNQFILVGVIITVMMKMNILKQEVMVVAVVVVLQTIIVVVEVVPLLEMTVVDQIEILAAVIENNRSNGKQVILYGYNFCCPFFF
jgi:hypothetical protein